MFTLIIDSSAIKQEYANYRITKDAFVDISDIKRVPNIENKNHCVKDVTMNEDKSRIRRNPVIFAIIRSIALNILRLNNFKNISLATFSLSLNFNKLFTLKGIA